MSGLEVVSVHVPKTGGTSFYSALRRHYGDALIEDHGHVPGAGHDLAEPPNLPAHARAVNGHFRGDRYADYVDAFHVTFLRDPVEQFISNYFFWLTLPPTENWLHQRLLSERPDILTYARDYAGSVLRGFFGGCDLTRFDYVGFSDRREQDYRVLSRILGFYIDPSFHDNPTVLSPELKAQRAELEANERTLGELRDALHLDYEFYALFRAHWT